MSYKKIVMEGIEYNLVPVTTPVVVETPEYKVGDWVIYKLSIGKCVTRMIIADGNYASIGSDKLDKMYQEWMTIGAARANKSHIVKHATQGQIQNHLIELAKKKGYDKATKVASVITGGSFDFNFEKLTYEERTKGFNDGNVTIYKDGQWGQILETTIEKKFVFGREEVIVTKSDNGTFLIKCKGEVGTYNQLTSIILEPFKSNLFGTVSVKSFNLHNDTIPTSNLVIKPYELIVNNITIGCLTGSYKELLDIYNYIKEKDKK